MNKKIKRVGGGKIPYYSPECLVVQLHPEKHYLQSGSLHGPEWDPDPDEIG